MIDILRTILSFIPLLLLLYAVYKFFKWIRYCGDYWAQRDYEDYKRRVKYEESIIEIAKQIKK